MMTLKVYQVHLMEEEELVTTLHLNFISRKIKMSGTN